MPGPVSRTKNLTRVADCSAATISTDPRSVNLRALVVRLRSTRRSARACPRRRSVVGSLTSTARPFSAAMGRTMSHTDSSSSARDTGAGRSSASWSPPCATSSAPSRSEEHTSELQSRFDLVCRLLLEKKKGHALALNGDLLYWRRRLLLRSVKKCLNLARADAMTHGLDSGFDFVLTAGTCGFARVVS